MMTTTSSAATLSDQKRDFTAAPVRIIVADDHPVVRFGIRNMLRPQSAFVVVAEASDGDDAVVQTLQFDPDILLLDLSMPRMPGLEAMRAIVERAASVKIILLTSAITPQQVVEALQIGARGIVLKEAVAGELDRAIRSVLSGDYWIGGRRVANLITSLRELTQKIAATPTPRTYGLTHRELDVVGSIVEGCSNKDIARQFSISEETVKRHLSNIFDKTGVSTRLELALFAINHKIATPGGD